MHVDIDEVDDVVLPDDDGNALPGLFSSKDCPKGWFGLKVPAGGTLSELM